MKNKQILTLVEEVKGVKLRTNCNGKFLLMGLAMITEKLLYGYNVKAEDLHKIIDEVKEGKK